MDGLGAGFPVAPALLELCMTLELGGKLPFQRCVLVRASRASSRATPRPRAELMLVGDSGHAGTGCSSSSSSLEL